MATKAEKRKQKKKADRRKRLEKEKNMRGNAGRFRYVLECEMKKGQWKPMKRFKDRDGVQRHIDETEAIRKRGDTDIIPGRVIDLNNFNQIVARIPGYTAELVQTMRDAAKLDVKIPIDLTNEKSQDNLSESPAN